MEICNSCPSISEEDLQAARKELKTYVDITDEDLMKVYVLAVRHARERRSTMIAVGSVMTEGVVTIRKESTVSEAVRLFAENKVTGMPVIDEENRVVGVVSDADVGSRGAKGGFLKKIIGRWHDKPHRNGEDCVEDVMSSPPITTLPDADIKEVAEVLDMHRIKRLPVVDQQGKLVGIISRGDIIRAMGKK